MRDGRQRQQAATPLGVRPVPAGLEWTLQLAECGHIITRTFLGKEVTADDRYAGLSSVQTFHGLRVTAIPRRAACDKCDWPTGAGTRRVPLSR